MADWNLIRERATATILRKQALPALPTWSRLEPLSLTSGDLTPGAQALVADPLWMLARQWQFDELRGEDAGSPIQATVVGETAPFTRFHAAGSPAQRTAASASAESVDLAAADDPGAPPLEVQVEAETPAVLPIRLRAQCGAHLLRLLRTAGLGALADWTSTEFAFSVDADGEADPWRAMVERLPDPVAVAEACAPERAADGSLNALPARIDAAAGADSAKARRVLGAWLAWFDGQLARPLGQSWDPHRLEYAFQMQSDLAGGPVVLDVAEYTGGRLDWFHGDLAESPRLGSAAPVAGARPLADTSLPSPVRYAGMPSDRLFAFEDSAVYLGGVEAGRTDLARLAVTEFALAYGCDWFEVGIVLPYGSVTRIDRVDVVDCFGREVRVGPTAEHSSPGWTAFQSTPITDSSRLSRVFVLAPTVASVLEGRPLEEVALVRDEMANLVWGVEHVVPDPSTGEPVDRTRSGSRMADDRPAAIAETAANATLTYRLMTPVPDNWIPFVAFREDPGAIRAHHVLERRPMLRFPPTGPTELVHPRGTLLLTRDDADPVSDRLRIAEEEVPREGVVVSRTFQLTRTVGGGSVLWIGRRVHVGRGEGSSGLRFDVAHPRG